MMTIEELKSELLNRTYPEEVRISVDQVVVDTQKFLQVSFIEAELWQRELEKCPAWLRLLKFKEAISK